jgi:subtilisin family serine protease
MRLPAGAGAAGTATWVVGARPTPASAAIARRHGARAVLPGGYVVPRARARALAAALRRRGLLTYAEPDAPRRLAQTARAIPDDPLSASNRWRDAAVDPTLGPPAVDEDSPVLALVDSKLEAGHPEFVAGNVSTIRARPVGNLHGTATAAVAAAPKNDTGILGVWPGMRALNVSLPSEGVSCSDSAGGIAAAVREGAAVINMSYGSQTFCFLEYQALQRATARGITLVAAAGNEFDAGNPLEFPASLPHVLTVAALTPQDRAAFFSNENSAIDLSAPGVRILTAVPVAFDEDGTADGYMELDGTSFSAPIVAAAATWLRAVRPDLSVDQVAQVIRLSARDVGREGWDASTGFGALDLKAALDRRPPGVDPKEPNEDIPFVSGAVFARRDAPVWTGRRRTSLFATLDHYEDPGDVYRIRIPPRRLVRIRATPRFGDPDLELYAGTARHVATRRRLVVASRRSGRRSEFVSVRSRTDQTVTAYVRVFTPGRGSSLDAAYTLTIR